MDVGAWLDAAALLVGSVAQATGWLGWMGAAGVFLVLALLAVQFGTRR